MAREVQITPKRIKFAKQKESELFNDLIEITSGKQQEIVNIITGAVAEIKSDLIEKVQNYDFKGMAC